MLLGFWWPLTVVEGPQMQLEVIFIGLSLVSNVCLTLSRLPTSDQQVINRARACLSGSSTVIIVLS